MDHPVLLQTNKGSIIECRDTRFGRNRLFMTLRPERVFRQSLKRLLIKNNFWNPLISGMYQPCLANF